MATALAKAGRLKPEIQLAQAISEYEAVLDDDQKSMFRRYRRDSPPVAADVVGLTSQVDMDEKRRRFTRQCVGTRLTNILQSVQQFSTLVDTVIGGAQNLLASAIWGVLKMSLQVLWTPFLGLQNVKLFYEPLKVIPRALHKVHYLELIRRVIHS